ncbi:MAG: S53 family peptidase [Herpetosiphonaceae bacterium]|nr:S53 family peptidase [Herpetosiphonaceae bacterium]
MKQTAAPPTTADCEAQFGIACYQPFQLQQAYNLAPLYSQGLNGTGRTIVIVDSFGSPTIQQDLHKFDRAFGLADPPSLKIIQPAGAVPPFDPNDPTMAGWAEETTLDVEWAHVMAPGANILLVETPVAETEGVTGFPEIVQAENYVINNKLGDVISQSFAATEETFPSPDALRHLRSAFENASLHEVTVLGATGDDGATDAFLDGTCCYPTRVTAWPATDPLVTAVGGTHLTLGSRGNRLAPDEVWNDFGATGGGLSSVFERPGFQDSVENVVGPQRGVPDISMSAAVDGGVLVYFSFLPGQAGYYVFGGTSVATPLFAGIVSIAAQKAGHSLGLINDQLYRLAKNSGSGIVDVTRGNNSFSFTDANGNPVTVTGYTAGRGYDLASGLGTINAAKFVNAIAP